MKTTPDPVVDLAVIIPAFAPLAREMVRLHPRQAQDGKAEVDVDASKIGGIFLWPDNEPWPHCTLCSENDGDAPRAYSPILQLNKRDVPELGFKEGSDLFQLLWCPTDHNHDKTYCPRPMIVWRNRSDVGKFLTEIPKVEEQQYCNYIPKPCVIHPERVTEYPDMTEMEFQPDLLKLLESNGTLLAIGEDQEYPMEPSEIYQYTLSTAYGWKVGGYPFYSQSSTMKKCPSCNTNMNYLLTIASGEFDAASRDRWLATEDQNVSSRVDYDRYAAAHSAPGVMLGDAGEMNVFICRSCDDSPIAWEFQCS